MTMENQTMENMLQNKFQRFIINNTTQNNER